MGVQVSHTVTGTFGSTATLAELDELVTAARAAGFVDSARVRIDKFVGDQRDPSYTTITVTAR